MLTFVMKCREGKNNTNVYNELINAAKNNDYNLTSFERPIIL